MCWQYTRKWKSSRHFAAALTSWSNWCQNRWTPSSTDARSDHDTVADTGALSVWFSVGLCTLVGYPESSRRPDTRHRHQPDSGRQHLSLVRLEASPLLSFYSRPRQASPEAHSEAYGFSSQISRRVDSRKQARYLLRMEREEKLISLWMSGNSSLYFCGEVHTLVTVSCMHPLDRIQSKF